MPNWYNRNMSQEKGDKSRYSAIINADVFVPMNDDEEKEKDMASYVLREYLPKTNDSSLNTGIDSSVRLNIINIKPYY